MGLRHGSVMVAGCQKSERKNVEVFAFGEQMFRHFFVLEKTWWRSGI